MANEPAVVIDHVSKRFPNTARPAVDDCSLEVQRGQFIVLLGPSGCGKTTLLKMINRLYEPTSGRILVQGTDITHVAATQLRRRIGYVIQQTGLFPHMRIEDNIATVPRLLGWQRQQIDTRIDELLDLIGLPHDYRKRYPRQLSGGEQQRVGIARALAADPEIMLMDEPFGALDAITRGRLQDELLSIQRKLHKTILFVTHDVDEALRLADKIIVMRDGRIVQFGTSVQILTQPADEFVSKLVNADDMLRQMSVIRVGSVVAAAGNGQVAAGDYPRIMADDDMRSALSILLSSGCEALTVVDGDHVLGYLTLQAVQNTARRTQQQSAGSHLAAS